MNYLALLEYSFKEHKSVLEDKTLGRLQYLAENIFNFTTYENIVSSLMAQKALDVCKAISNRETFEYIKSEDGNLWYLLMVNMPFFDGKLAWGTSIRGAFWDLHGDKKFTIESCGLYNSYDEQILKLDFNEYEWLKFINDMIKFSEV